MKLFCVSDLHLEHLTDDGIAAVAQGMVRDADVMLLCGDICYVPGAVKDLAVLCQGQKNVLWVMGNHEFWLKGVDPRVIVGQAETACAALREAGINIQLMHRKVVEIDGVRFVGCTLWYPQSPAAILQQVEFSDFRRISNAEHWIYGEAKRDAQFLRDWVDERTVVMTHHLPHWGAVAPRFAGDQANCFYVHDQSKLIEKRQPQMWFHGHSHEALDMKVGDTRLIRNPWGYPNEQGCDYQPRVYEVFP